MRRRLFKPRPAALSDGLDVGALAPLVDMMTLLLVFLLRSYSTEAAPAPPEGRFELAGTVSEEARKNGAVVVLVSAEAVYIDGRRVIAVAYLPPELLVREVYDRLLLTRDKKRIEVHADRAIPWGVLKRVLHTARAAGFEELSLVAANTSSL
ncbi:MAG: biopolymer transporter ExbD [Pseudomonadota bacterium]|nr:biopolymer transporter ExbD [Pseudomonadota bacterium]